MSNPVHKEWADTMTPLFDERVRAAPGVPTEVFALDPDGEPGPAQMTYRTGLRAGARGRRCDHDMPTARCLPTSWTRSARRAPVGSGRGSRTATPGPTANPTISTRREAALAASSRYQAWVESYASHLDERTAGEGPRRTREVFRCD